MRDENVLGNEYKSMANTVISHQPVWGRHKSITLCIILTTSFQSIRWRLIYVWRTVYGVAGFMCGGFEWKTVHQTLKHTRNLILWSKLFLVRRYRGVHVWKLSQIQTDIRIGCALNMRERRRKCNKARRRRGEKKIIADGITSAENQDQDAMLWYCMGKTESMSKSWVFLLFYFPLCEWWNIRDTYWNHSATDTLDAVVFCCSLFFGESAVIFYEISLPFASVLRTKRTVFSLENGISIWTTTTTTKKTESIFGTSKP